MEKKGTVTSLSSLFPAEEAHKASRRVQDTITERQQQLNQLKGFITDNANLINLVHKLPDELHHDIMVPFGKAAFFPGRLIHTNEFMVLLGEGYYAERTSKQTTEILKRREKALESQVETLKAIMQDLKTEASFFDATASEAAEGLVEIREDYAEDGSSTQLAKTESKSSEPTNTLGVDNTKAASEDEYARIFSRMDELEKEEEAAAASDESDEDEQIQNELEIEEEEAARASEETDEDDQIQNELAHRVSRASVTPEVRRSPEVRSSQVVAPGMQAVAKDVSSPGNCPAPKSSMMSKYSELPKINERVQSPLTASNPAVIGSIVEHPHNIGTNSAEQQTGNHSSKPVSRFKMQRK